MNLSINPINLNQINYCQNTNFCSRNNTAVFNRSAKEIGNFISYAKEKSNGKTEYKTADILCNMVGKCLGKEYKFGLIDSPTSDYLRELVGSFKSVPIWAAITKDAAKAIDVIERVLKSKESQGKTCDEVVDRMLVELKPKK